MMRERRRKSSIARRRIAPATLSGDIERQFRTASSSRRLEPSAEIFPLAAAPASRAAPH
jgi:hypothetical protein